MEFQHGQDRIFAQDKTGKLVAEVTFPTTGGVAHIDHTFVDGSLRGQGVAGQLMEAAAAEIRGAGHKVHLTCPYAVKWFEQHPENGDLL